MYFKSYIVTSKIGSINARTFSCIRTEQSRTEHFFIDIKLRPLSSFKIPYKLRFYIIKFKELFSSAYTRKLVKLSSFVEIIINKFSSAA